MDEGEHWALFETVARRREFLTLLSEEPLDKASIVRQLDVSRSTVNRAMSTLQAHGLVERANSRYRTTPFGAAIRRHFHETVATVDRLVNARPLFEQRTDRELPLALFRDATVITNEDDRHAPARFLIGLLTDATRVRSTGGIFRDGFPTPVSKRLKNGEQLRMNLVLSRRTFDWAQAYHEPEICRILSSDRHDLRVVDSHRSTTVVVLERAAASRADAADGTTDETAAVVVVYDDRDEPVGLVYATDPCTLEWATRRVERTWEAGSRPPLCDVA